MAPILKSPLIPIRWSQLQSKKAPSAIACPLQAATIGLGKVKIFNLLMSEDSRVMINALLKLGVKVDVKKEYTVVHGKVCKL